MPTFIFTDIEDSSGKWERHKEAFAKALARHDAVMNAAIPQFGGRIVKHTGDGIFAVFDNGDALACAMTLGLTFRRLDWRLVGGLRIRIGVHAGDAEVRSNDFFGPAVGLAQRVMGAGQGGQILFTPAAQDACKLPPRASVHQLGAKLLKGYSEAQILLELVLPPEEEKAGGGPGLAPEVEPGDFGAVHALLAKYLESRTYVEGIMAFRKLAARDNRNAHLYLCLGVLYEQGGYSEEAVRALRSAVQLDPGQEAAYPLLASSCLLRGHLELAVATCQEGLRRFPDAPRLHFHLGYAFAQRRLHDQAIAEFEAELRVDPNCSQAAYNVENLRKRQTAGLRMA